MHEMRTLLSEKGPAVGKTVVQTCIVHLIRNSLAFVSWKDRKAILPAIKAIYRAENADMAIIRLEEFEACKGSRVFRTRMIFAASGKKQVLLELAEPYIND